MTESIGTYYTDIRPNAEGFVERMRGPILPQIDQFGRDAGDRFAAAFSRVVQDRIGDPFTRSRPDVDRRSRDSGRSAGDAFGRELDSRITAAIRALPDIQLDADVSEAQRRLGEIRATMAGLTEELLGIRLSDEEVLANLGVLKGDLESLTGPEHDIRVRLNAHAAAAEIAALEAGLGKLDTAGGGGSGALDKVSSKSKTAEKSAHSLLSTLLLLAPAIVPLGGAAIAAGVAGAAGLGALAIGVAGVRAEMKAGTEEGAQFGAGLGVLKNDFHSLEQAAASGLLKPFDQSIDAIHAKMPQLRADIAQTSAQAGDIGSKVIGGLASGFQTFDPLVQDVLGYVDKLAGRFENWAGGPGGEKFAHVLVKDFDQAVPLLESLATTASHFISALSPAGGGAVSYLTLLSGVINEVPVGVLKAGTTAFIAFKVAVATSAGLKAAAAWLTEYAAAETAAAAATTELAAAQGALGAAAGAGAIGGLRGMAGGMATLITRAVPFVAAYAGVAFAIKSVASATDDWAQSADRAKSLTHNISDWVGNVLTLNFSGAGQDIANQRAANTAAADVAKAQQQIDLINKGRAAYVSQLTGASVGDAQIAAADKMAEALGKDQQNIALLTRVYNAQSTIYGPLSKKAIAAGQEYNQANLKFLRDRQVFEGALSGTAKDASFAKAFGQPASPDATKASAEQIEQSLTTYRRLMAELAKVRGDYVRQSQAPKIAALDYATTSPGIGYTDAAKGLGDYTKTLQTVINAESLFTKITDDHTVSIRTQSGSIKIEQKAWAQALAESNGDYAKAIGYVEGHRRAYQLDVQDQQRAQVEQARITAAVSAAATQYKLTADQVQVYGELVGISADQLAKGTVSQANFLAAVKQVEAVVADGPPAMQDWVAALAQFDAGADTAASRAGLMMHAMIDLNGSTLGYANTMAAAATANQQLVTDFAKLKKGVLDLKTGQLDYHNAAAGPVLGDLAQLQQAAGQAASATYQMEVAEKGRAQASKDAASVYYSDTHDALLKEASQLGLTHDQAKALADQYFHWPKNAATQIEALGEDKVQSTLSAILEDLDHFTGGHHADLYLTGHLDPAANAIRAVLNSGSAAFQVREQADGGVMDFYARGGIREHHVAQIAPAGAMRVWAEPETGGEGYVPLAPSKRTRSREVTAEIARRLGGYATFFESGGFTGVTVPPPPKSAASSSSSAGHAAAAAKDLASLTNAVRDGISKMMSALFGNTAALGAAENELAHAADRAGAAQSILNTLAGQRTTLLEDSALLARTNAQVTKAQTYLNGLQSKYNDLRSSVAGTAGAFDITSAGVRDQIYNDVAAPPVSITTITADARARAAAAVLERTQLQQARAKGLNLTDYQQLAAGDPAAEAAQLKALAAATPAEIKAYNAARATLQRVSGFTGRDVAGQVYGSQLDTARALLDGFNPATNPALAASVKSLANSLFGAGKYASRGLAAGLLDEDSELKAAMKHLADIMVSEIEHGLDIHSPSHLMRKYGRQVPRGLALGIVDDLPIVRDAAAQMAIHAQPVSLQPSAAARAFAGRGGAFPAGRSVTINALDAADLLAKMKIVEYHDQHASVSRGAG